MSLLKTLSDVAGGVSSAGSIVSGFKGVAGLLGLGGNSQEQQVKYQKQLIDYQNTINQQNALASYDRQRQLTADSFLLSKIGMKQAGINTSQGSTSANAASVANISPPSSPSALTPQPAVDSQYSQMASLSNLGLNSLVAKANIRKTNAEAQGTEIDNLSRNYLNMKKAGLMSSEIRKNFEEAAYQATVNKYADSRLSAEADSANSKAIIDQADSGVRAAMNKADYDLKVQEIFNKVQTGILTQREAMTELKKLSLMDSQINLNNASAGELNTRSALNVSNARGVELDNRLKSLTFDDKLVESFESAEQSKLQTVAMKLRNLPHSVSEHFTRSALFALERIQKGHGSAADFALVAAQTTREYAQYANNEAKDWSKIILGALPMSSAGSAQTGERGSGYVVNSPYVPQY